MGDAGNFIFQESNYLQSSFSAFQEMRIKKEHTDVIIKVKDRSFPAHLVVLAARIPYFRKICHRDKEIFFHEMDPYVIESLINFAYEGKLKITATNVQNMFFAAVCLHITQVQKICFSFIGKNSNIDPTTLSLIKFIPSDDSIRQKFDEFCSSEEFLFLPYYELKELLGRDDLKVKNEEKVFEALIKWTKVSLAERQHWLPYLLTEIRMNYISPEHLIEKVAAEGLIKMSDQCRHIVEDAKSYHLLRKRIMNYSFRTVPRLYSGTCLANSSTETTHNVCDNPITTVAVPHSNAVTTVCTTVSRSDAVSTECTTVAHSVADTTVATSQNIAQRVGAATIATKNQNVACNGATATVVTASQTVAQGDCSVTVTKNRSVPQSDISTVVTANQSSLRGNVSNINGMSPSRSINVNQHVLSRIRYGMYAVRSFTSVGTFVSYYDQKNEMWINLCKSSQKYHVEHVTAVKDELYVFFANSVETFNLVTQEWTVVERLRSAVTGAGIASYGNLIFIFGGLKVSSKIRCFDTLQQKWLRDEAMKYPCRDMSVVSSPEKHIYLSGGYNGSSCYLTFLKFHTITKQWTELSPMRCARMEHGSTILNDKLYVCGGHNSHSKFLRSMEVYDRKTNRWSFVSNPRIPWHSLSLVTCSNKVYAFGGTTEKDDCFLNVEIYDPQSNLWLPGVPVPRHCTKVTQGTPCDALPASEEKLPDAIKGVVIVPED